MGVARIYVETSVWSHAFAEDAPESRAATIAFLDQVRKGAFEIFISDVVMRELARSPGELAERLAALVAELHPAELELDEEADGLAGKFIALGAVPAGKIEDAEHVAIAVVNELDMLVSWNHRHLVNVRRRELFGHISVMNGFYKPLHIVTPPEVGDESQQGA